MAATKAAYCGSEKKLTGGTLREKRTFVAVVAFARAVAFAALEFVGIARFRIGAGAGEVLRYAAS